MPLLEPLKARLSRLHEAVRSGFWAVPAACVGVALLLALGFVQLDRELSSTPGFTFGASTDGAREVLSAITSAMITFTGLVFTITIVVLQLTSSQFSPRALRTFLRDRKTQTSLGVFVATFVYAVMVLRTVGGGDDGDFVPAASTTFAVALLLLSVGVFIQYIHHIATSIQVSAVIAAAADEARGALDRRFPAGTDEPPDSRLLRRPDDPASAVVRARRSGVVTLVGEARLVRLACEADVLLRTSVRLGDYVPEGAPLVEVVGDPASLDLAAVGTCLTQARDRTLQQDLAFGLRQLVDIAERALSTGVNDPTTAVQAMDELHDLLRRLATRPLRSGLHVDGHGALRLVLPPERLEDFLSLALDEIEQYGADALQVQHRLDALLDDVLAAALPEHRAAVQQRVDRRARA